LLWQTGCRIAGNFCDVYRSDHFLALISLYPLSTFLSILRSASAAGRASREAACATRSRRTQIPALRVSCWQKEQRRICAGGQKPGGDCRPSIASANLFR
jgi:hypothetical protein